MHFHVLYFIIHNLTLKQLKTSIVSIMVVLAATAAEHFFVEPIRPQNIQILDVCNHSMRKMKLTSTDHVVVALN